MTGSTLRRVALTSALLCACGAHTTTTQPSAQGVAVTVSPGAVRLAPGGTQTFASVVTGTANVSVTWSVTEGSAGGSVSSTGSYVAPGTNGTYHVVATSNADSSKSATATVTVATPAVTVAVAPIGATVAPGGTQAFTATVSNATNTSVTWSVLEGAAGGTVSTAGLYTAPATQGTYHVVATSVATPTASATVAVAVTTFDFLPADRLTVWNPGLNAIGGVPSRTTVCQTLSPSGGDDTAAINGALSACPANQVVLLGTGTFTVNGTIYVGSNKVLRGSGTGSTILNGPDNTSGGPIGIQIGGASGTNSTVNLTADALKGTYTAQVASVPAGLAVGSLVSVDQLDDMTIVNYGDHPGSSADWNFSRTNRSIAQVNEVAAINGTTITVTAPWHITFKVSQTAQLMGGRTPGQYAGVEDLTVQNADNNVVISDSKYSWVKNIESAGSRGVSVNLLGTWRCEVRDSYVHDTKNATPGGAGYGIGFGWAAADNLVENNISIRFNKVMVMRASGGGNVIAYNYMDDGYIAYDPEWMETGLNASHDKCPHYELFEGNQGFNFSGDSTWGNAVYITAFRNQFLGRRRGSGGLSSYTFLSGSTLLYYEDRSAVQAVGLMVGHWWYSFVGNVLGYSGMTLPVIRSFGGPQFTGFTYDTATAGSGTWFPMWNLGWEPVAPYTGDPQVAATAIRDGNFDYATNAVQWANGAKTLPASLYLAGKPAFFGSNPWPWIDASGTTKVYTLPARARFDAMP